MVRLWEGVEHLAPAPAPSPAPPPPPAGEVSREASSVTEGACERSGASHAPSVRLAKPRLTPPPPAAGEEQRRPNISSPGGRKEGSEPMISDPRKATH